MTSGHSHGELNVKDPIHNKFDTKSKIIITLLLIIAIIQIITYEQIILFTLIFILLLRFYEIDIKSLLKKSLVPLPLIFSLSLLAYISYINDGLINFAGVSIKYNRFELAVFYFIRSSLIVFISLLLIESEESFFEIIYALDDFKLPDTLINILLLMYRSALDIQVEAKRMLDVRYSRSPKSKWTTSLYTYKIIGYMVGAIILRAFIKKDIRRDALISRRFKGKLFHKKKYWSFNGILLLWILSIVTILILLAVDRSFLPIGNRNV